MSRPYEIIRELLARIFLNPNVKCGYSMLHTGDISTVSLEYKPIAKITQPPIGTSPRISKMSQINTEVEHLDELTINTPIQIEPLEPEEIHSEPVSFGSENELSFGTTSWETDLSIKSTRPMPKPAFERIVPLKHRLHVNKVPARFLASERDVYKFNTKFRQVFRVDLGLACRQPMHNRSVNLRDLDSQLLLKYWRALLKKIPSGLGKDLEMLAVFHDVEVDYFDNVEFDGSTTRLRLRPKVPSERKKVKDIRCDIIYGRYIPKGTILTVVLRSD